MADGEKKGAIKQRGRPAVAGNSLPPSSGAANTKIHFFGPNGDAIFVFSFEIKKEQSENGGGGNAKKV